MRFHHYLAGFALFFGIHSMFAQSANGTSSSQAQPGLVVRPGAPDPVDIKIQDALRERDAIIRNLLERVQELENRLNTTETTAAARTTNAAARTTTTPVATPTPVAAAVVREAAVVNNSAYDEEERKASQSLDQALLVRGGLLLPNGTLEADNTASYFSMSSDHLTVDGFALLPILVVGDITSERLRRDIVIHSLTTRLGLPAKFQMDVTVPYGYILNRTVDATGTQSSASQFGLGDYQRRLLPPAFHPRTRQRSRPARELPLQVQHRHQLLRLAERR